MAKKKERETPADVEGPTFEESLQSLEQIVQQLEEGQLGLSESLACYESGVKHLKRCYQLLERAERKIELLAGVDADGNPLTQPFDDEAMSLEKKADARSRRRSRPPNSDESARGDVADDDIDSPPALF